ncbi:MAG: hypothetical protein HYR66_16890 [Sphingobacteriales bacterium]|nr:hypothetical protein [Sphingobacteriales bacterium]MBI3720299.1 hypothetical protein [Sphingobacteriales bacterium]
MSPKKKSTKKKNSKSKLQQGHGKSSPGHSTATGDNIVAPPPSGSDTPIPIGIPVSEEAFNKMKEQAKQIIKPSKN